MNESLGLVGVTATNFMLKRFTLPGSISCNDEGRLSPALADVQRTRTLIVVIFIIIIVVVTAALTARDLDREQLPVLAHRAVRYEGRSGLALRPAVCLHVQEPPVASEHAAGVDHSGRLP